MKKATQDDCRRFVERDVYYCVSSLVSTLASAAPEGHSPAPTAWAELYEQAVELSMPIPDYEEAVRWHAGQNMDRAELVEALSERDVAIGDAADAPTLCDVLLAALEADDLWEEFAAKHDVEPYEREVYEHWIVSKWLAGKLEAKGEKVDYDFAGLVVWARCTTGQAIMIDGVIESIVTEALNA